MIDFRTARANMVESQVRPNGITDRRIIAAMATLPREAFVPQALRDIAYMDEDLPLMPGRAVIEPMALARLIDLAAIRPGDKVLHIGCAVGYGTAVLAQLAASVLAVDEDAELTASAAASLGALGIGNVKVEQGRHDGEVAQHGPFDVIFIEGRIPEVPKHLVNKLAEGGRLVAVVGKEIASKAVILTKSDGAVSRRAAFDASVAALPGFAAPAPAFVF